MCLYKCESVVEWLQRAKGTTEEFREFKEDVRGRDRGRDRGRGTSFFVPLSAS